MNAPKVIVRVEVIQSVLEPRIDSDGVEDYYVVSKRLLSEREWVEDRAKALGAEA